MTIELKPSQQQIEQTPGAIAQPLQGSIGLTSLFLAILALSFAAIFIRLSERELGPVATVFNRFWVATIILGLGKVFETFRERHFHDSLLEKEHYTVSDVVLLLVMSCLFSGTLITWAWSLTQTSVANSNLLHNVTPLFTTLMGWLFLSQCFEGRFLIGMVIAISGSILIGLGDLQVASDNFTGDSLALLSAVFSAANLLTVEKLRAKFSATTILLWCSCCGALLTFPIVLLTEDVLFPYSWAGWLTIIAQALVCQVLGQSLQAYNLKGFSSGFVAVFLLLDPVITAILAWIIFSEQLSPLNWLAFSIVLAGIYIAKPSQGAEKVTPFGN
ncbi:DMT family transporter [Microcoleus sp. S28C3]|uniref:DMT family transporter n=1 Tax=Microcoleus sp. S28C3 TaxID=3055414 RepID=UPI002FD39921